MTEPSQSHRSIKSGYRHGEHFIECACGAILAVLDNDMPTDEVQMLASMWREHIWPAVDSTKYELPTIKRRPLPGQLRYLADQLTDVGDRVPDDLFAVIGGVAFSLHMIADELTTGENK